MRHFSQKRRIVYFVYNMYNYYPFYIKINKKYAAILLAALYKNYFIIRITHKLALPRFRFLEKYLYLIFIHIVNSQL
jgi:hypothetical protein